MTSRAVAASLLLTLFPPAQAPAPSPLPADRRAGAESINPEDCKKWLSVLASDEFGGRGTGTEGFKKAAHYVAERFKEFGLTPVGDDGTYFQKVPFESTGVDAGRSYLRLMADDEEKLKIQAGNGLGGRINEKSDADLELVVLVASADSNLDALALRGRAVLLVDQSPAGTGRGGSPVLARVQRGQPGAILVVDDQQANQPLDRSNRVRFSGGGAGVRGGEFRQPNRYAVTKDKALALIKAAGLLPDALEAKDPAVLVVAEGKRLQVHVETTTKEAFACNVIGRLEGSDPKLREELVGIGSHLDHIGTGPGGRVNNGADDDGSGTTGVLAVARAFATNPKRPARSILFMCFCGEELGLIGSAWYADHPLFPNEKMVAEIQMDMIGRNEEGDNDPDPAANENKLKLVGTRKLSDDLHELCLRVNQEHIGFEYEYDEEDVFSRSDHVNFARKNIPIAFLFTGFHPQYHHPDDDVERINFPKLARVARLAYALAFEVAERSERPKVDRTYEEAMPARQPRRLRGESRPQSAPASQPVVR